MTNYQMKNVKIVLLCLLLVSIFKQYRHLFTRVFAFRKYKRFRQINTDIQLYILCTSGGKCVLDLPILYSKQF